LLPVPLFVRDGMDRSVLLNGTSGNFCLDTSLKTEADHRAKAWSANVGHYVAIRADQVEVQRWNKTISDVERYSLSAVSRDLEKFHTYLVDTEPPVQRAVIPHVVRVFRQIRNREELAGGTDSLKVLLLLLACAATSKPRSNVNDTEWAIPNDSEGLSMSIDEAEWELLIESLLGPTDSDLRLDLQLLIRHAAGPVFQEAHREASLIDAAQLPLPGFARKAAGVRAADLGVGVHFTPPSLARSVVQQALAAADLHDNFTIFDPACGSAEFLREALRQIRLSGFKGNLKLIGWDISSTACDMARFLLRWEQKNDPAPIEFEINQLDSLAEKWPRDSDLLLMNPPFVSYEQLTPEHRDAVRHVMGSLAQGRIEYSSAFIYKAVESLHPQAILGTIIPASFYESASAARLRDWVRERLSPWLLARLGSLALFPDAIVDAGLLIGKVNGGNTKELLAFWADEKSESTAEGLRFLRKATMLSRPRQSIAIDREGFSIYHAPELVQSDTSWSPKPYAAWNFARQLCHLPAVNDLFNIHTGARSGLVRAFLLRKEKWLSLSKKEQRYFRPAVVNESIESGKLNDSVYVFYPYGEFSIDSERQLRSLLPSFYKTQLAKYRPMLESRQSNAKEGKWWQMYRPTLWQQVRIPKIVSVEYGDIGAFAWDTKGDFVVVGGYAWMPRSPLKGTGKFSLKLGLSYLAILNSPVFFELIASNSRKISGGQWDLSNKYIGGLPLPSLLSVGESDVVHALFRFGSAIQSGNPVDWPSLAKVVRTAYGI